MRKFLCSFCAGLFITVFASFSASAASFVMFPTSWDVGQGFACAITSDTEYSDPSVTWLDRTASLDVEPGGDGFISYSMLGSFVRDVKPGTYPIVFGFTQGGNRYSVSGEIKLRERKYPSENLKVSPKMVNPPKSELERIKKESALTAKALRTMSVKRRWTTPPNKPLSNMTVTSRYGFTRIYNGTPKGCHAGTDLRAAMNTPIRAPFAGTVVLTGGHYYAGKSVYVDSGNGVISLFFHLNNIKVKAGDRVEKGQVIALSGNSGRVTGPHLHYGLYLNGQYVDFMPMLETSITRMLKLTERAQVN